jgi:hypothetical protein
MDAFFSAFSFKFLISTAAIRAAEFALALCFLDGSFKIWISVAAISLQPQCLFFKLLIGPSNFRFQLLP